MKKFNPGNTKHGMRHTPIYNSWRGMKDRCLCASHQKFNDYGARGIKVCERWLAFENFLEDMGVPPVGHSIDRIDVNGNYEPGNCRWVLNAKQARNRRDTVWLSMNGEKKTLPEWSLDTGIPTETIRARLRRGWSDATALTTHVLSTSESTKRANDFRLEHNATPGGAS